MRGLITWNKMRTWRLECGNYLIPYDVLLMYYSMEAGFGWPEILLNLLGLGMVFLVFYYADRRKSWVV